MFRKDKINWKAVAQRLAICAGRAAILDHKGRFDDRELKAVLDFIPHQNPQWAGPTMTRANLDEGGGFFSCLRESFAQAAARANHEPREPAAPERNLAEFIKTGSRS